MATLGINPTIPLDIKPSTAEPPGEIYGQVLGLRNAAIQGQVQQANLARINDENQAAQRAQQARQALATALQNNTKPGPDGKLAIDSDGLTAEMTAGGWGPEAIAANKARADELQSAQKAINEQLDTHAKQATQFSNIAGTIQYPNFDEPDPAVKQTQLANYQATGRNAIAQALQQGLIDPQHARWALGALQNPSPETAAQLKQYGMMGVPHAEQMTDLRNQTNDIIENNLRKAQTKTAQTEGVQKEVSLFAQTAPDNPDDWAARYAKLSPEAQAAIPATYSPENLAKVKKSAVPIQAQPEFDLKSVEAAAAKSANPTADGALVDSVIDPNKNADLNTRTKALVASARAAGMPPAAIAGILKDGADQIGRTETAVATAKATVPIKIALAGATEAAKNQAGQLSDEAADIAAEAYRKTGVMPNIGYRNAAAMRQVMNRAAQMGPLDLATEQAAFKANQASLTALTKNRDAVSAFENTAGKNLDLFLNQATKVIDTGSPWINSPLRTVDAKLLGNAELPAYNAARQVAINEIAKVTSNPGLTGQLSDSARNEVANFNPANATFAQTYKVAQVLKQDMQNRHQAYNDQIADITTRIGKGGTVQDQTASPASALPKGNGAVIDRATIQKFLDASGGDKDKARKAISDNGWVIPQAQ